MTFTSLDDMRIGGWLTRPRDEPVERSVVVSHGYGGREGPDFHLPFRRVALIFPCARGISRSARADIPGNPDDHVLHGIEQRETYVHGGCAADTVWCAASALLELFPMAARCGLDGVICGHIHHATLHELNGVLYCNDGDWVESCTALVEYPDGTLEILRWSHQQAVVAVREPRGLPETAPAPGWATG